MLARKGKSLKDIVEVLKVFYDNIGDDEATNQPANSDSSKSQPSLPDADASPPQKLILGELITFLEGVQ